MSRYENKIGDSHLTAPIELSNATDKIASERFERKIRLRPSVTERIYKSESTISDCIDVIDNGSLLMCGDVYGWAYKKYPGRNKNLLTVGFRLGIQLVIRDVSEGSCVESYEPLLEELSFTLFVSVNRRFSARRGQPVVPEDFMPTRFNDPFFLTGTAYKKAIEAMEADWEAADALRRSGVTIIYQDLTGVPSYKLPRIQAEIASGRAVDWRSRNMAPQQ